MNEDKEYPIWKGNTEVDLNQYITLKLEGRKTNLYINGEYFRACKYAIIHIPVDDIDRYDDIKSMDELLERMPDESTRFHNGMNTISPFTEFTVHASNLQAWVDHDYNTTLLDMKLAFPILKELSDLGDKSALIKLKEEIARRFDSREPSVINYLLNEGYEEYLDKEEWESIDTSLITDPKSVGILYQKRVVGMRERFISMINEEITNTKFQFSPKFIRHLEFLRKEDYPFIRIEKISHPMVIKWLINNDFPKAREKLKDLVVSKLKEGNRGIIYVVRHDLHLEFPKSELAKFINLDKLRDIFSMMKLANYGMEDAKKIIRDLFPPVSLKVKELIHYTTEEDLDLHQLNILKMLKYIPEEKKKRFFDYQYFANGSIKCVVAKIPPKKREMNESVLPLEARSFFHQLYINEESPFKNFFHPQPDLYLEDLDEFITNSDSFSLRLEGRGVGEFTVIRSLPNLKLLQLGSNTSIFRGLEHLAGLEILILAGCEHLDLDEIPFDTLPSLKKLNLMYCELTDLDDISLPSTIKELNLDGNFITDVNPILERFSNLEHLTVKNNTIHQPLRIHGHDHLKKLDLRNNAIPSVSVDEMPKLTRLYLTHNTIKKIYIGRLEKVYRVGLGDNPIQEIGGKWEMPSLMDMQIDKGLARINDKRIKSLGYTRTYRERKVGYGYYRVQKNGGDGK